jgi:hypothetical protein
LLYQIAYLLVSNRADIYIAQEGEQPSRPTGKTRAVHLALDSDTVLKTHEGSTSKLLMEGACLKHSNADLLLRAS